MTTTVSWPFLIALGQLVALLVIAVSLTQNLFYFSLLLVALVSLAVRPPREGTRALWSSLVDVAPPLTVLVPARDEEATIVESVRGLLALQYPNVRVVVVDDGSTDGTLRRLVDAFDLERRPPVAGGPLPHAPCRATWVSRTVDRLLVIEKGQGGKADALNAGLNLVETDLFCAVDADSLLEADSLLRAVRPFLDDPRTVAVGGTVRVANGCPVRGGRVRDVRLARNWLALVQNVEYLRAFVMARLAMERLGALPIVSGAFGIFDTRLARAAGGYATWTVGEDLELVLRMHRYARDHGLPDAVRFVPEPVCWTQVPESLRDLARQRIRWHRGALESFFAHARMAFRPRYGGLGLLGLSSMFVIDVLAPVVEVAGYLLLPLFWWAGLVWWEFILAWLALTFVFGVVVSCGSLVLEELELRRYPRARDLAVLVLVAVVENFGYRQLVNVWRVLGHWHYLRGATGWGRLVRRPFDSAPAAATPEA